MNKKRITPQQRRQRELAWMLYIIEGAIANTHHALAVNCVTFTNEDKAAVCLAQDRLYSAAKAMRKQLGRIQ